jgi:lysophospholipase L1-like esterase
MRTHWVVIASAIVLLLVGCRTTPQERDAERPDPQARADGLAETRADAPEAPTAAAAWYEAEIRAFEEADRASPPVPGRVLFVGSSSIRMWVTLAEDMAPAPVVNRGFGGSKTAEVLAVFDRIVTVQAPSVIVYYCGDNDLGTDNTDWESAANGFIAFDRLARALWPRVRVFYIPIKPSVARWGNWEAMSRANEAVREYCEGTEGAEYLDTATPMLGVDGRPDPSLFLEDGLHLNEKGYAVWAAVVRGPVVEAWRDASGQAAQAGKLGG